MPGDDNQLLRKLPKIDKLLERDDIRALDAPRWAVVDAVRLAVAERREAIREGRSDDVSIDAGEVAERAAALVRPSLRQVINATGVVVHTNLGRSPLPAPVMERVAALALGYSNLEYDLDAGTRGSRHTHLTELITDLTGAEDAVVVNNNAGAVMLALAAMAADREVIVSRGELIEIGGSFRIPDVMRLSGARLVEVGTTNKTHLGDYQGAISDATGLLLKVHRSNFALVGFTAEVEAAELVALGAQFGIPAAMDLGSGCLLEADELIELGLPAEPSVRAVVASGLDLVTFSGDKLLGGPQAGVIVGKAEAVARVRSHPMMRALRPDKLTITALQTTLALYRDGDPRVDIPGLAMLSTPLAELRARAEGLLRSVSEPPDWLDAAVVPCESTVGGGAMPTATLPSWGVALTCLDDDRNADDIERALREGPVPIIARIVDDQVVLDVRTLFREDDLAAVAAAVAAL